MDIKKQAWMQFMRTGTVADYLQFCAMENKEKPRSLPSAQATWHSAGEG